MGKSEMIISLVTTSLVFLILITGIIHFILQFKKRKLAYEKDKIETTQKHLQDLLQTQLEIQAQTMQHIGREIHDSVGQKLTLASLYTQQLAYENKAPQINDKIENIGNIINTSLAELRQLSKSLTDDSISESGIAELVQQECTKVNDLKKCTVSFSSDQKIQPLPYQVKSILLRIVQEFLQNSIKHSDCKNIQVALRSNESALILNLKDDGKGFELKDTKGKGIGLSNMKKRTELIGGSCYIDSSAGKGTTLIITIPLQQLK